MAKIQVILEENEQRTIEGKVIVSAKKFIDLEELEVGYCSLLKLTHHGINTLVNVSSLGKHVLISLDERGNVISKLICKSAVNASEYVISIQEKNLLLLSQDIGAENWKNLSFVKLS